MAITFPVAQADLGDLFPVQEVVWQLMHQQQLSGTGAGEGLAADLAPALWQADVSLRPLLHTEARAMSAKLAALDGSIQTFYLANPLGWYPAEDPHGTLLGASEVTIESINANRKEVAFAGLPAGYVLSSGDFFAVDYGSPSRRALIQLVGSAVADGSGETSQIEVRPHLRPGISTTFEAVFAKPAAKVKITASSKRETMHSANRTRISFSVLQTLAAG